MPILLSRLLTTENIDHGWSDITIHDVETRISKYSGKYYHPEISLLKTLEDFFYDEDSEKKRMAIDYLDLINRVGKQAYDLGKRIGIPYISVSNIKTYLLGQEEFKSRQEEFYPFPLYVSANPEEYDTIGIIIDQHGKVLEIHEGNDEATPETITLVNKLLNPSGKRVRIYGSHGSKVVQDIDISGYLPKNLYVSPSKSHASSYWGEDRQLFTGIIDQNSISQESDIDWKTIDKTKIEHFKYI